MNQDRYIAVLLLGLVGVAARLTAQLSESTMEGEPGPKFFPAFVLVLLTILSALLFIFGGRKPNGGGQTDESLRLDEKLPLGEALLHFAVFIAGLAGIALIGFSPSIFISLTATLVIAGWKPFPKAIVFSGILMAIVHVLFVRLLDIPLPPGSLFM